MFLFRDVSWNPSIIIVKKLLRTKDATENLIAIFIYGVDGMMDGMGWMKLVFD
jgi:hypothetical protein